MIKTTLNERLHKQPPLPLPWLYEWRSSGEVVLFTGAKEGVCLRGGMNGVGSHRMDYFDFSDPGWRPFEPGESLTLTCEDDRMIDS